MGFSRLTGVTLLAVGVAAGAVLGAALGRVRAVGVSGPSMVPTLRDGDALLAAPSRRVRPGDVVIARFRSRPDLLVVKRAVRAGAAGGWWVQGDNPLVTDDSRRYGTADVLGRVLVRYWPRVSRSGMRIPEGADYRDGSDI